MAHAVRLTFYCSPACAGDRLSLLLGAVRHLSSIVLIVARLRVHSLCQLECMRHTPIYETLAQTTE